MTRCTRLSTQTAARPTRSRTGARRTAIMATAMTSADRSSPKPPATIARVLPETSPPMEMITTKAMFDVMPASVSVQPARVGSAPCDTIRR